MSFANRLPHAAVLIVAVIVLVLLYAPNLWVPAVGTLNDDERGDTETATANEASTRSAKASSGGELEIPILDPCPAGESVESSASNTVSTEELNARIAEYEDVVRRIGEQLVVSLDAEHLHAAAILEADPAGRIRLIARALGTNRNDAFLAWDAVRICAEARAQTRCPMQDWEDRLLALDRQNSEAWVRIAANRLQEGDGKAALSAMKQAASSPETRVYWSESIEMYERALAAGGDYGFPERAALALGFAASNQPNYSAYHSMCREQSASSQEWAYACLAYGEVVERQGKTDMAQSIARSIQERALESLGEQERLAALVVRQERVRRDRWEYAKSRHELSDAIMISNPTVFFGYLAAIRKDGEIAARVFLAEETERWLDQSKDLECIQ